MTDHPEGFGARSPGGQQQGDGERVLLPFLPFLEVLFKSTGRGLTLLFRQLFCWAAWVVEQSVWLQRGESDPLQVPVAMGQKRARNLPNELKVGIAEASSTGVLGRSGAKVAESVARLRKRPKLVPPPPPTPWRTLLSPGTG